MTDSSSCMDPAVKKFSWEFKFRYFAYGKFAKFKFQLLFYFFKSLNDSF